MISKTNRRTMLFIAAIAFAFCIVIAIGFIGRSTSKAVTNESIVGSWIADGQYNSFSDSGTHYRVVFKRGSSFLLEKYSSVNATEPANSVRGIYKISEGASDSSSRIHFATQWGESISSCFNDFPSAKWDASIKGHQLILVADDGDEKTRIVFVKMD